MKKTEQQKSREEMAMDEVGHTTIRPSAAWALAIFFLAVIYAEPLHQHIIEWRTAKETGTPWSPPSLEIFRSIPETFAPIREHGLSLSSIIAANKIALSRINEYEDSLEDESVTGQKVRPMLQTFFSGWPGVGNEQAYIGRAGWLFYRPGVDHLTGPGFLDQQQMARREATASELLAAPNPDPREAIIDFKRQLEKRGITLIVMPVPVKPAIHPEKFSASTDGDLLQNKSYSMFINDLEKSEVIVFDPSRLLFSRKIKTGKAQYLATDTHWRPDAMERVAEQLAEFVAPFMSSSLSISASLSRNCYKKQENNLLLTTQSPSPFGRGLGVRVGEAIRNYRRIPVEISGSGDIALMLDLQTNQTAYPPEPVTINQVLAENEQFWRASEDAELLVLGDSFSNIYSLEPMGWGESAGFVEQFAFYLGAPVDRLIRNDSGAFATRAMLSRELARGRDRLAGKKVVVWQFTARELSTGDWRIIPMISGEEPDTNFFVPEPGAQIVVTGTVNAVSYVPRPGTVPYPDHILSIHLVDLPDNGSAVVYMQSMRDNKWTRAARLRSGEEITIRLQPWTSVSDQYEGLNRSELDDFELQLQEPCWGEWDF